jgi:hypothetical protein
MLRGHTKRFHRRICRPSCRRVSSMERWLDVLRSSIWFSIERAGLRACMYRFPCLALVHFVARSLLDPELFEAVVEGMRHSFGGLSKGCEVTLEMVAGLDVGPCLVIGDREFRAFLSFGPPAPCPSIPTTLGPSVSRLATSGPQFS